MRCTFQTVVALCVCCRVTGLEDLPGVVQTLGSSQSFGAQIVEAKQAISAQEANAKWGAGAARSASAGDADALSASSRSRTHTAVFSPKAKQAGWKPASAAPAKPAAKEVAESIPNRDRYVKKSEWESHKQHSAVDREMDALKHADSALAYQEERAVKKLQADVEELDHLITRRHLLTDRKNETEGDALAIELHAALLLEAAGDLRKKKRFGDAATARDDAAEMKDAAVSLRGSVAEIQDLSADIQRDTEDGKRMNKQVRLLAKQRAAFRRQITVVEAESDHLMEKEETVNDLEAFEKAGYQGVTDEDDPYMQEAEAALQAVSGWDSKKLDENAVKAREAMTKGLSANPGQAVQALKQLGGR